MTTVLGRYGFADMQIDSPSDRDPLLLNSGIIGRQFCENSRPI
jgi:hypothetical protein